MSAIFGIVNLDSRPVAEADLALMSAALSDYGPDGNYVWIDGYVGLGQRLMRFTPEDCFDRQLAVHAEGQRILVADARIDNRPELTHELGILPAQARELTDSEFILRAYDKWGAGCARHLIGAFVFALRDLREQSVLIARSQMGERSLFFYETSRLFAFASAPKGLFALPFVPREVNRQSVADFLVFAPKEPGSSFFSGINRLQGGHSITVRNGGVESRQYRELDIREIRFPRDSDYVEAFNSIFDRVIADQLRSLTPVGVSMSGGLDSTAVAAAAAMKLRSEGKRLHTFTEVPRAGFSGPVPKGNYADETPYVQAMARTYDNLDVHFIQSNGRFYLDELDQFSAAAEVPILGASNWPWIKAIVQEAYLLGARVLLTGWPGNLTISWNGQGLLPQLVRERKWGRALHEARSLAACGARHSTLHVLLHQCLIPLLPNSIWMAAKQLRAGKMPGSTTGFPWQIYSPIRTEFAIDQKVDERAREKGHDYRFRSPPQIRALHLIRQGELRADTARAQEALFGVQKRDPASDVRLVEFCLSIPEDQYLRNGKPRWLIRRAMADRLPSEVLDNNQRGLQAAGWFEPLRAAHSRIEEELDRFDNSVLARNALDLARMRRLVEEIQGKRSDTANFLSEYRGVLERGLTMGRFLTWFEAAG